MFLSIVTTLYKSSPYVDEFYMRISKEARKITDTYQIIFVDDGSPDDSLQKAIKLYEVDSKVEVIQLSRNFGHHKAILTGLRHARGDFVFLIDSDLEEEPELFSRFWNEMQDNHDVDVVYGVQESRKGGFFERWSGRVFYRLYNFLSDVKVPKNLITARLFTSKAVNMIMEYSEHELCLGCIFHHLGLNQRELKIQKYDHSPSTYTLTKKMILMVDSIVAFSNKPLWFIFLSGLFITLFSIVAILKLFVDKIMYDTVIDGWTSVMISIWFFGGIMILVLGIIGIYISKIFIEVKHRPFTLIDKIYSKVD